MADASFVRADDPVYVTLAASASIGELRQLADGRAAYLNSFEAGTTGDQKTYFGRQQVVITKATGVVILDGGKVFWDRSARNATYRANDDADFYVGTCVGGAASADDTVAVNLNVEPRYVIDLARDAFVSVPIGTLALGGLGVYRNGGTTRFVLDATSEAQKLDALSKAGFSTGSNAIVEMAFTVETDGGSSVDASIGVASATHATDADSIAQHLLLHMDGSATAIKVQSKDGTTTVTATDTTKTYTTGTAATVRKEAWFDFSDPADVQVYIDGVNVLPSSVFNVSAAASTWKLLAHIEKTSSTDTHKIDIDWLRVRLKEQ